MIAAGVFSKHTVWQITQCDGPKMVCACLKYDVSVAIFMLLTLMPLPCIGLTLCCSQAANARVSQLAPEDRAQLLRHLKLKWQSVNQAYQGGSLCVDSAVKKAKKEELERQLAEIEKDIKTLERGEVVLVVDD